MKAEPSRLISQKLTENLEPLIVGFTKLVTEIIFSTQKLQATYLHILTHLDK